MALSSPRRRLGLCLTATTMLVAPGLALAQSRPAQTADETTVEDVVVTASGYAQNVRNAPATITVVTADEIKKRSYSDITDVLVNVPGVHIQGGGVEQSVMIRGMSADYTLFLVDGRPQQDNQAFNPNGTLSGGPINFLPPLDSIERIEVVRGPASSLYGSDAIGGVINIITKRVVNEFGGSITSEYIHAGQGNDVTNDGYQTSLALNVPILTDILSLQLTGGLRHQDESDLVAGDKDAASDPEFKRRNIGAKLSLRLNEANTLTFGGGHTVQERTHTPGRSLAATAAATFSESLRDNYFLTHEARYSGFEWNSYLNYDASENPSRVNATTGNGIEFDTLIANTQATFFLNRHTISVGANYRNEELRDGATNGLNLPGIVVPTDIVSMERTQYAAFIEDNWKLTDDLALLLSGRYDDSDDFGDHFSPKVYLVYSVTDSLSIKGGVTTGYKVPSLRMSATDFGSTSMGGVIIGNPNLKPETTINYEIGLSYSNRQIGLSSSLTAYRNEFEDKLLRTGRICAPNIDCVWGGVTYPAHQFGYTTYENVDTAELQGVEWTLDWKITNDITWRHSYTFSESEQTSGTYKGSPLNDIPEHMFNGSLTWQANDKLDLWGQVNYRGETSGRSVASSGSQTNNVQYPAYTFFNLGGVYEVSPEARLNLGVYNVFNETVTPEDGFAYVLDGRRYSVSLSLNF